VSTEYPPPPAGPGEPGQRGDQPQNIATAIAEISERATLLVREEIELAKAEVSEKATKLIKGAVVGVAAGVFFFTALVFALVGCAWLLYYFLPGNEYTFFWGFFAMAVILVLLGVLAGLIAAKVVKRSSPPVPKMAIEEARKIREAVSPAQDGPAGTASAPAPASAGER
jgi:Putative Actinobacterial Holin-X, holin superfamily III